jgi:hypothetical protein
MSPHLVLGVSLALTGCATGPDVTQLCGVWASDNAKEQWWLDGNDLRGEGRMIEADHEVVSEVLALRRTRAGHIYVAKPDEATPTEFAPIDVAAAKWGPGDIEGAEHFEHFAWANYEHDFPQEIHYVLAGDRLTAIISGPGRESGWEFQRTAACTEQP